MKRRKQKGKKKMEMKKVAMGYGAGVVGASVGSQVLGDIGGDVAAKGQAGIGGVAKFLPTAGSVVGGGLVLNQVKVLGSVVKKKKRYR